MLSSIDVPQPANIVWERGLGLVYTFAEKAARGLLSAQLCLNYHPIFMLPKLESLNISPFYM